MRTAFTRRKKPIAYAFIDSQNLNLGVQKAGWKMDWRKFREYLRKEYNVRQAYMFIGYMAENEALYEQMHDAGYAVVLKPTVDINTAVDEASAKPTQADGPQGSTARSTKGNVDADLVLYAMKEIPNYDKAIIVSGDGDFFGLVEYLAKKKKLLKVMTPNWQYSTLLKQFDSYIVRLDQQRKRLSYHDYRRRK